MIENVIVDSVKNEPLLSMFVLSQRDKIVKIVEEKLRLFLSDNAYNTINSAIEPRVASLFDSRIKDVCEKFSIDETKLKTGVDTILETSIPYAQAGFEAIDIKGIVENKLKGMDTRKVEKLINDVASRELKGIENLGWLLGGLIGIINAFNIHIILTKLIS